MILPDFLNTGDKVAIISPATKVKHEYVEGARRWLLDRGFVPMVMKYADGEASGCISGSFAAAKGNRLTDFFDALLDPDIKAILCARGGYGCIQLLPHISYGIVKDNPKWLIGFSDISALHAAFYGSEVMSLHAPMAKHLTLHPDDACSNAIYDVLTGKKMPNLAFAPHPLNTEGEAKGRLIGGNLAVLNGLASTPFDMLDIHGMEDCIIFLEDIGENIYEVDRMLTRLYLSGALFLAKALLFGHFTEYHEDLNYESMEEMIRARLDNLGVRLPVAFNLPVGHTDDNMPVLIGATATVEITSEFTTLRYD